MSDSLGSAPADADFVFCESPLEALRELTESLEKTHDVSIIREPTLCLTMLRAEDSLEKQEFVLGEALATECDVTVDGAPGFGVCMGDQPQRSYCLAVLDALLSRGLPSIERFLREQGLQLAEQEQREFNLTLRTQVNFKLMEQE